MKDAHDKLMISASERDLLFSLFEICRTTSSQNDFVFKVYPILTKIMPHSRFVCGIANTDTHRIDYIINISFPDNYLKSITLPNGRVSSPVVDQWLKTQAPVFYDERFTPLGISDSNWKASFRQNKLVNVAAHGLLDLQGKAASYFCFSGVPAWSVHHAALLEMVVPHLHTAMKRQFTSNQKPDCHLLSAREIEVLQFISRGKTNPEIARILGISVWTVKIHVRNFMEKLNVSTRGHAVAKAINHGLVSNVRM